MNVPEIKIKYKRGVTHREGINSSDHVYKFFKKVFDSDTIEWNEEFIILLLDRKNVPLGYFKVSSGGLSATYVDARMIFSVALKAAAHSIIIAHNHPSGSTLPSEHDITLTNKLVEAGKVLDITVLDHLIITKDSYLSMSDESII